MEKEYVPSRQVKRQIRRNAAKRALARKKEEVRTRTTNKVKGGTATIKE